MSDPVVQGQVLDLRMLCCRAWKRRYFVLFTTFACALLAAAGTGLFVAPQYQSSVLLYVNNNMHPTEGGGLRITSGDLSASRKLADSYIVILHSWETLDAILEYAGSDRSLEECSAMFYAEAVQETEVIRITVTGPDYRETKRLADAAAFILPRRIHGIVVGASARVVESAIEEPVPVSPSCTNIAVLGMIIGMALSFFAVLLGSFRNVHFCYLVLGEKPWYS